MAVKKADPHRRRHRSTSSLRLFVRNRERSLRLEMPERPGRRPAGVAARRIATRAGGLRSNRVGTRTRVCLWAAAAGSALVLGLGLVHSVTVLNPTLRAVAETMTTLFALSGTALLRGQFGHSRRLRDLLLFAGLLTLGLLHVFCYAVPAVLALGAGSAFLAALVCGNAAVAGALAAAALVPSNRLVAAGGRPRIAAAGLSVTVVGAALLVGLAFHTLLVPTSTHPVEGVARSLEYPLGAVLVVLAAGLFGVSGVAFARQARTEALEIVVPLAGASAALAGASLYWLAMPALPPNWVAPDVGLRVIAWALVFIAVIGRELDLQSVMRLAAVTAERRRVAGNLHDGLAQDLAVINAHRSLFSDSLGAEHPVTLAASRALALSRTTIVELSDSLSGTLVEALGDVTRELSHRFGIDVAVDVVLDHEPAADLREHVVRIAREAIANAAWHGEAQHVTVSVRRRRAGLVLRVRDDGRGMEEPSRHRAEEGFGLRSIRERVTTRRGYLLVTALPAGGTELKVLLP
jgi:signal transduction histidine kinase